MELKIWLHKTQASCQTILLLSLVEQEEEEE